MPVAIISGLSKAAGVGVLVKNGGMLEMLVRVQTVVLDKTGTLTHGQTAAVDIMTTPPFTADAVLDVSRPGKPTDNSHIESFNGKFRAECLNARWFTSLDDARAKMKDCGGDYNEFRPHSEIGNKVPISLMNGSLAFLST